MPEQLSDAQRAEIDRLADSVELLHAEDVVAFARNPKTALHSRFEWDDTKAAEEHRLDQARGVIRLYVTVLPGNDEPIRTFVSLYQDRTHGGGYRNIRAVVRNRTMREALLAQALAELDRMRERYAAVEELAKVWREVDRAAKKAEAARAA